MLAFAENDRGSPILRELVSMALASGRYRAEICRAAGVCDSALNNIERGRNPSLGTVEALLGTLGGRLAIVPDEGE